MGARIVFVHQDALFPPAHGGAKCSRAIVEALAERGHDCRVVMRVRPGGPFPDAFAQSEAALRERRLSVETGGLWRFSHGGVSYAGVPLGRDFTRAAAEALGELHPDLVLVSDDVLLDRTGLLERMVEAARGRVSLLAWTLLCLPFGPWSTAPSQRQSELVRGLARLFVPSEFVAGYFERWLGKRATALRFPVYPTPPYERISDRKGPVVLVNPCQAKGLSIFAALARALPEIAFGAIPGWGETGHVLEVLRGLPNVSPRPRRDRIADALRGASVVLLPSLVDETFPLIPTEAMLHGLPVIASRLGAVPDAMLGVDHVLDVRPLERLQVPVGNAGASFLCPEQDTSPWIEVLGSLLGSADAYDALSERALAAARGYVASLSWDATCARLLFG